ncbi:hypothetical protein C8J55DRAFT_121013 [Lentinula edodes]|uniref:Uncharacterized protein n=1 Tax=Lentinula lateritia TaxID=40482 RepID=A0A9W9A8T7_9AGAR|nr:hypothetical protein C8J55DRAFT_121013 [Lentinula edodes]
MTMLLYIKHRLVIDKIRNDYLSFVRQLKPDDPAVDWLSLLRTHHPDLVCITVDSLLTHTPPWRSRPMGYGRVWVYGVVTPSDIRDDLPNREL